MNTVPANARPRLDHSSLVAIGRALRRLRGRTTQGEIGAALGVGQGAVSQWEAGKRQPTYEQISRFEREMKLAPGAVYVTAGLVEVDGVEAALRADSALDELEVELLLDSYRLSVRRTKDRRKLRK